VIVRALVSCRRGGGVAGRNGSAYRAAALFLAGAAAAVLPRDTCGAEAEAETVARVNGEPVTRAELDRMAQNPLTVRQVQQELGIERPDSAELERVALRKLIHRRLMLDEARRRNIVVTEKELDAAIVALRRRFEDLAAFGAWMREQRLDDASLFQSVREDIALDRVKAALVDGVRGSEKGVKRYYDAHKDEFARQEVRLQIIAVGDEATAKEIVAALRRGEDFGRMASRRSLGVRARQGGDTGWVPNETLASPLREAVATLKPGEARGPLPRGSEFLIVRLYERRHAGTKSLDEARPEIERRLAAEKRHETLQAWLEEQENESKIEILAGRAAAATARAR
jgi:parvulin-like peptidyl-prolyl isomerase